MKQPKHPYTVHMRLSPLWKLWLLLFPKADLNNMYLAFGRRIYIPRGKELPMDMQVHELIHLRQHGFSYRKAILWWVRYYFDKKFRYSQELEAYRAQYEWYCNTQQVTYKDKFEYRLAIATILSSEMYGKLATKTEAFEEIGKKERQ